jgi:hypothetical protein
MPACFQRVIDAIIRELEMEMEVGAYLDDIVGSDKSKEENIIRAVKLIHKLTFYKIIINQKKSYFACQVMPTLGYIVDGKGIHLHPSKIEGITNLSFPTTSTQMKSFLGMCNFARNILKYYAQKVAPLDAVSLQKTITPNEKLLASFEASKQAVINAATIVTEDPTETNHCLPCQRVNIQRQGYHLSYTVIIRC